MKRRCVKGVRVRPRRVVDSHAQSELSRADLVVLVNAIVSQAIREVEEAERSTKQAEEAA